MRMQRELQIRRARRHDPRRCHAHARMRHRRRLIG
jgi:hypothetical protein